jgi:hypothetical protein
LLDLKKGRKRVVSKREREGRHRQEMKTGRALKRPRAMGGQVGQRQPDERKRGKRDGGD